MPNTVDHMRSERLKTEMRECLRDLLDRQLGSLTLTGSKRDAAKKALLGAYPHAIEELAASTPQMVSDASRELDESLGALPTDVQG